MAMNAHKCARCTLPHVCATWCTGAETGQLTQIHDSERPTPVRSDCVHTSSDIRERTRSPRREGAWLGKHAGLAGSIPQAGPGAARRRCAATSPEHRRPSRGGAPEPWGLALTVAPRAEQWVSAGPTAGRSPSQPRTAASRLLHGVPTAHLEASEESLCPRPSPSALASAHLLALGWCMRQGLGLTLPRGLCHYSRT